MKKKEKKAFPIINPNAAGIDIASKEHWVAVNPELDEEPIRPFGTYTEDLYKIVAWLKHCRVDTVAMEATGIYWVNLFLILEEAGFKTILVNAKQTKNVSGKKTDVDDAEWIRQLHSCGLLSASFQPDTFTRKLRTYMRHRRNMTEMAATHIHMMQKAMEQLNIKLQHVIADITGKSGQAIISAILEGERDPEKLVGCIDGRIKASRDDIRKSLHAVWKEEYLFELQQSFEMYQQYRKMITVCDRQIEKLLHEKSETDIITPAKKMLVKSNKNNLNFDAKEMLQKLTGTDLTAVFGISDSLALEILSEIGCNMDKWPTAKHFTSWLNLAPNNRKSGGKIISSKVPKKRNKAGQMLKMAAYAVQRSNNWLAFFYHRIKAKSGAAKAITATARKIGVILYKMMRDKVEFTPVPLDKYQQIFTEIKIRRIKRQAQQLGLQVVPV